MPHVKSIICLLILLVFGSNAIAQPVKEKHSEILAAVGQKDFQTVIIRIETLRKDTPKRFISNNYDYLLARVKENLGDFSGAVSDYQSVINRDSMLKGYALWHLSQIMRFSGNLFMERLYLQELSTVPQESFLREAAESRIVRSYFEGGNFNTSINLLSGNMKFGSNTESSELASDAENPPPKATLFRDDTVLLAHAYIQNKQPEKAMEVLKKLIEDVPKPDQPDDFSLAAVKGLDRLSVGDEKFGEEVPKLSASDHFARAKIYQFNRNFPLARLHYKAIAVSHSESDLIPQSIFQIGRGFTQERNYKKAVEFFERLFAEFPDNDLARFALYQSASSFANLNKTTESVARFEQYINQNPRANNLERAYLNIIDVYRDADDPINALRWASKAQNRFRGEMGEAVALFSQTRIHISQTNWKSALMDLNALQEKKNLGGIRVAGGTNKKEIRFLRGFVLEKLGRHSEAIDDYLSIPDGLREYYGWRATERLKALAKNGQAKIAIDKEHQTLEEIANQKITVTNAEAIRDAAQKAFRLAQTPDSKKALQTTIANSYSLLPRYNAIPKMNVRKFRNEGTTASRKNGTSEDRHRLIARSLLFLGLFDEGTPELEKALHRENSRDFGSLSDFPAETSFTLATFYKRGDMANRAIGYVEGTWKTISRDHQIELIPRAQLELLYPIPYESVLVKSAIAKKVDPRFLLSIMRQESRFRANIKSIAAARGLMQFISTTAEKMAGEMQLDDFAQNDLYNPSTAIGIGAHYVANIFRDFPDQPSAVAASYNGGEDRMMRWFRRAKSDDPDQYVPEIIFSQTKDYTYKVMANYRIYKILCDENLRPLSSD